MWIKGEPDQIAEFHNRRNCLAVLCSTMTFQNQQIVFLSHQRWNTHVTAVHNTVMRLARENRVLFIEPPDSIGS